MSPLTLLAYEAVAFMFTLFAAWFIIEVFWKTPSEQRRSPGQPAES